MKAEKSYQKGRGAPDAQPGKNGRKRRKIVIALLAIASLLAVSAAGVFFGLKIYYPVKYKNEVVKYSAEYGFAPELIMAVIHTESGFDTDALSGAGAMGLMQVMPATALYVCEISGIDDFHIYDLYDPDVNIKIGCAYLKYLADKYEDIQLALYAYNAGEGNVNLWLMNPDYSAGGKTLYRVPFKETEQYYIKIMRARKYYKTVNF